MTFLYTFFTTLTVILLVSAIILGALLAVIYVYDIVDERFGGLWALIAGIALIAVLGALGISVIETFGGGQ